jgi:hypothetical protein
VADVLVAAGKSFRRGTAWTQLLLNCRQLHDQTLTSGVARAVALAFAPIVEAEGNDCHAHLLAYVDKWVPDAIESIERNRHMNRATDFKRINPAALEALLVDLCNRACAPLDLALYTIDLHS